MFFEPPQIGGPWPPHKPKVGPANSPCEGHFLKERKNFALRELAHVPVPEAWTMKSNIKIK